MLGSCGSHSSESREGIAYGPSSSIHDGYSSSVKVLYLLLRRAKCRHCHSLAGSQARPVTPSACQIDLHPSAKLPPHTSLRLGSVEPVASPERRGDISRLGPLASRVFGIPLRTRRDPNPIFTWQAYRNREVTQSM